MNSRLIILMTLALHFVMLRSWCQDLAGPDMVICAGDYVTLGGDIPPDACVEWTPPDYLNDPHSHHPVAHLFSPMTYTVTVYFSDGTRDSDEVEIEIDTYFDIEVVPLRECFEAGSALEASDFKIKTSPIENNQYFTILQIIPDVVPTQNQNNYSVDVELLLTNTCSSELESKGTTIVGHNKEYSESTNQDPTYDEYTQWGLTLISKICEYEGTGSDESSHNLYGNVKMKSLCCNKSSNNSSQIQYSNYLGNFNIKDISKKMLLLVHNEESYSLFVDEIKFTFTYTFQIDDIECPISGSKWTECVDVSPAFTVKGSLHPPEPLLPFEESPFFELNENWKNGLHGEMNYNLNIIEWPELKFCLPVVPDAYWAWDFIIGYFISEDYWSGYIEGNSFSRIQGDFMFYHQTEIYYPPEWLRPEVSESPSNFVIQE
jgi:hypothetical protein